MRGVLESLPIEEYDLKTFKQLADINSIDILTPTSSTRPYSPRLGEVTNIWFDLSCSYQSAGTADPYEDVDGIQHSLQMIRDIVTENESRYNHIFIGGFCMGGSLSLHLLNRCLPRQVKGVFCIGSYLIESSAVFASTTSYNKNLPILMMHGVDDDKVQIGWCRATGTSLHLKEYDNLQLKEFDSVGHDVSGDMMVSLLHWMQDIISTSADPTIDDMITVNKADCDGLMVSTMHSSNGSAEVPYRLLSLGDNKYKIIFQAAGSLHDQLTCRPILACGGVFDLVVFDAGSVATTCTSSDPHHCAIEIGKRMCNRIRSDGASINACPMA